LRGEVAELTKTIATMESKYNHDEWFWRYGEVPPSVHPLRPDQIIDVRKTIRSLETRVLGPLAQSISVVRDDLLMPAHGTPNGSFDRIVAQLYYDELFSPVLGLLGRVRNPKLEGDIRPAFVLFFKQYAELRRAMQRLAELQGRDLASAQGYAEWQQADERFYAKLEELPAEDPMWAIRDLVSDRAKRDKDYPQPLPAKLVADD
jgi:hypothetical protein